MSDMKAVKFTFDKDFEVREEDKDKARAAATKKQLDEARAQAFAEGVQEGRQQALTEIEAHSLTLLENIASTINLLQQDGQQLQELNEGKTAAIAHLIATKIAGTLVAERPEGIIENVITEAIRAAHRESDLQIFVAPDMIERISARLEQLKQSLSFSGQLHARALDTLSGVDCRVEWAKGGVEHVHADVIKHVEDIINTFMAAKVEDAESALIPMAEAEEPFVATALDANGQV